MQDPKRVVAESYDRIAERHAAWAVVTRAEERARYLGLLLGALPEHADVLELGCGAPGPTTRALASRYRLTAVDLSARSIELARTELPDVRFVHGDMTRVEFPEQSFDGVAAFYSIIHVPRDEHPALFARIASWLRPGGVFVAAIGARDTVSDWDPDWLGAPMFWSSHDAQTNQKLIVEAGFVIERACIETVEEDGLLTPFLWVIARRPE